MVNLCLPKRIFTADTVRARLRSDGCILCQGPLPPYPLPSLTLPRSDKPSAFSQTIGHPRCGWASHDVQDLQEIRTVYLKLTGASFLPLSPKKKKHFSEVVRDLLKFLLKPFFTSPPSHSGITKRWDLVPAPENRKRD